jgi:hypothetical protein
MAARRKLVDAYRDLLTKVGRTDTPDGVLLLILAETIESPESNGVSRAQLAVKIHACADRAFKGTTIETDALDDLTKRRRRMA